MTKTNTTTNQLIHFNIPKLVNNNLNLPVDPIEKTINILPENKFKSTFVAVETNTTTTTNNNNNNTNPNASIDDSTDKKLITESLEKNTESDTIITTTTTTPDNQSKTLNYEQVLKIKKLNKKNLKLLNKKKELEELKKLNAEERYQNIKKVNLLPI